VVPEPSAGCFSRFSGKLTSWVSNVSKVRKVPMESADSMGGGVHILGLSLQLLEIIPTGINIISMMTA